MKLVQVFSLPSLLLVMMVTYSILRTSVSFTHSSVARPHHVQHYGSSPTQLSESPMGRRDSLGGMATTLLGAGVVAGVAEILKDTLKKSADLKIAESISATSEQGDKLLSGLKNAASNGWSGKFKGQSYIPGRGLRGHEQEELIAGLKNAASNGWSGKFKGQSYIPGRGLRGHEQEELIAGLKNAASNGWSGKFKGQSYIPGRGLRGHEQDDIIV